ncbi:hypothetical protein ACROYT_G001362 [Oculina patagonica]
MPTTRGTNNRVAAGLPLQTSNASDLPASSVNSLLANVPRTSSAIVPGSSAIPASAPDVPSPAFLASVVTAVREALAAEQAVTSSSLQAPVQPSSVAGAIGGVPPTFSDQSLQSQASMLAASGLGFSSPLCRSDRLLSRKQSFVLPPGYSPVPPKLVTQIALNKFVEFSDLLSTNIEQSQSADNDPQLLFDGRVVITSTQKKPKKRIEDIGTWMEALSVYCCVLTAYFPNRAKDLLLYQMMILRTYRHFSGRVWLAYDRVFREHAAATNLTDWSAVNVQLFNFYAAGAVVRGDAVNVLSEPHGAPSSNVICRSWNSGRCVALSTRCRFAHKCSNCHGQHRVGDCSISSNKQTAESKCPPASPPHSRSKSRRS